MDKYTLKEILKVKDMSFTREEIEDIMNSELEKDPEEMDTELIDMCLDILTEEPEKKTDEEITDSSVRSDKKVKKIKLKKGLLVAAIIIILITISIPVGAKIFDIDVPEKILKIYDEYFRLSTDNGKQSQDLDSILDENDLKDVVLPKFLFSECTITNFESFNDKSITKVAFKYASKDNEIRGSVFVEKSDSYKDFIDGLPLVNDVYEKARNITVNGIDVLVFNKGYEGLIVYYIGEIEYKIKLESVTFEKTIEIASTI